MLLKDKTAIITGCTRGIGKSILETFAKNGADICACVRRHNYEFTRYIDALANNCNVSITEVYFDLTDAEQIKAGMKTILQTKQKIDILVNNAGITSENALFQMTTMKKMKEVFEVNFFAQMLVTQYIVRAMIKHKYGSIINIASIAGMDGDPAQLEYVASKAALIGATLKLSHELAVYNIRVNAVAPGLTETDMISGMREDLRSRTLNKCTMRRLGQPHEIAQAVLFLASNMSSYVTGQVLRVDGGM